MEFNAEKQVFELSTQDQIAFGQPQVPETVPVHEASQYLVRAEFRRIALASVDLSEMPQGALRSQVQLESQRNIAAMTQIIGILGEHVESPADGAAAWLREQS